jgi:hypothetical protein
VARLTDNEYLSRRDFLVDAWKFFPGVFTAVSYNEQLEVHRFFQTSKFLTPEEALDHRRLITAEEPSLPHRAGKLYLRIEAEAHRLRNQLENQPPQNPTIRVRVPAGRGKRQIRVVPLARPEVDVEKMAEALLTIVEEWTITERGEAA